MSEQRILVTGAGGFVGRHLCEALVRRQVPTEVAKAVSQEEAGEGRIALDIVDGAAVDDAVARIKPDVTVHLAAQSSVARSASDSHDTWAVNVTGTLNLASALARHAPTSTLLFVSSSEVYGTSFLRGPVTETTPPMPVSVYARSKRLAEDVCDTVLPSDARLIVARPFNHSGPGQREDFALPSFASQVARIEADLQAPQIRVGNIHPVRDFLHVRDVVAAYLALIDKSASLPRRFVCNIASERSCSLSETIEVLRRHARRDFEVVVDPARVRAFDIPSALGDASLLKATTGWQPTETVESLMVDLLENARRVLAPA